MNENLSECHDCFLKDRKHITLTGVKEVNAFDEKSVNLLTVMGALDIHGENIKISNFNTDTGDMEICGKFSAVIYTNDSIKKESLFSRLFK